MLLGLSFWSDRPSCTIYESRTGKENQDVVLICEITFANPSDGLEFFWSLNGTELNQTFIDELSHQDGMKSKIIIPAYDEQLFGTWTCSARNTVGQTDPNCTLFVDAPIGMIFFCSVFCFIYEFIIIHNAHTHRHTDLHQWAVQLIHFSGVLCIFVVKHNLFISKSTFSYMNYIHITYIFVIMMQEAFSISIIQNENSLILHYYISSSCS